MAEVPTGTIRVVSAEISRDGQYLLCQRLATAVLPLLWEFPSGRVRGEQTDQERLVEALQDRIGVTPVVGEKLLEMSHDYEGWSVVQVVYRCELSREPWPNNVAAIAWVNPEDFGDYPFPGADQATVEALLGD